MDHFFQHIEAATQDEETNPPWSNPRVGKNLTPPTPRTPRAKFFTHLRGWEVFVKQKTNQVRWFYE